jgi:hypothetical protein
MSTVPDRCVAGILPHIAVNLLRAAAASDDPKVVGKAIADVQKQYPKFFKEQHK